MSEEQTCRVNRTEGGNMVGSVLSQDDSKADTETVPTSTYIIPHLQRSYNKGAKISIRDLVDSP